MPRFIRAIMLAAAPGLLAAFASAATPAVASPGCMTLDEARKAFPGDHLHWHGAKHCWDNVGKGGVAKPAANANRDAAPASSASDKTGDADRPTASVKPAATNDAPVARPVAVPFIADDPIKLVSWPTSTPAASPAAPTQQEASAQLVPAAQQEAVSDEDASVVIGAPNAAPGSPDYLLEHCCWPPTIAEPPANAALLPRMVIASASACGLVAGLWLFVYRRRRPRLQRVKAGPSIFPERNARQHGGIADGGGPAHALDQRWQPEPPINTLAMYAPKRQRAAADAWRGAS